MLTNNIVLKSFLRKKSEDKIKNKLQSILREKNDLFKSMSKNYNDNFNLLKCDKHYNIIGSFHLKNDCIEY